MAFFVMFVLVPGGFFLAQVPDTRDGVIMDAFSGAVPVRTTLAGETLQRLSMAAYGTSLAWPLVWWANRDEIPDPERFKVGLKVRVPRLRADFSDPVIQAALEAAYQEVFLRYRSLEARTTAQRHWVLQQAGESGIDVDGSSWEGVMDSADRAWARTRVVRAPDFPGVTRAVVDAAAGAMVGTESGTIGPARVTALFPPPPSSAVAGFSKASTRDAFLDDVLAGAPLPLEEMEAWAAATEKGGDSERIIAALEQAAKAPDAPPQVHLALSIHYQRKGLLDKQYAALVRSEAAALRRPDVVFNVLLVSGRKKLIESRVPASEIMVGEVLVGQGCAGATVYLDGEARGVAPLFLAKVPAGAHTLRMQKTDHKDLEVPIDLGVAARVEVQETMALRVGRVSLLTNAWHGWYIDGEEYSLGHEADIPFGTHVMEIRDRNFESFRTTIKIQDEEVQTFEAAVKPLTHHWTIDSNPGGARILLDGKDLGTGPVTGVEVVSGNHELRLEAQGRQISLGQVTFDVENTVDQEGKPAMVHWLEPDTLEIPTASIRIDGKADDWATVKRPPMAQLRDGMDPAPAIPGTALRDVAIAQDKNFVYWYMAFSDGTPQFKDGISYGLIASATGVYDYFVSLKLGNRMGSGGMSYKPHIPSNIGRAKSNFIDLWDDRGSSSDFQIGEGFIEVRFPRTACLKQLRETTAVKVAAQVYREAQWHELGYERTITQAMALREDELKDREFLFQGGEEPIVMVGYSRLDRLGNPAGFQGVNDQRRKDGMATKFDGSGRLSYGPTWLLQGLDAFTITAWINPAKGLAGLTPVLSRLGPDRVWSMDLKDRVPVFTHWPDGLEETYSAIQRLGENTWTQVALRVGDGTLTWFINGKKIKDLPFLGQIASGNGDVTIGHGREGTHPSATPFRGNLGTMEIYPAALSDGTIKSLYENSK